MERSLNSIVEEISQNNEMHNEFAAMDEIDEIYNYCKNAGLDCSEDEFDAEVQNLIDSFEKDNDEISEYELRYIAGGKSHKKVNTKGSLILYVLTNSK